MRDAQSSRDRIAHWHSEVFEALRMKVSAARLAFGCLKSKFQKAPRFRTHETTMVLSKYEIVMLNDGLTAILQDMHRDLNEVSAIVADNMRRRDDMLLLQKRLRDELVKEEQ